MDNTSDFQAVLSSLLARLPEPIQNILTKYTPKQWLRLLIIVCGYLLLRPLLMKLGMQQQMKAHERSEQEEASKPGASLSPNDLRGQKLVMPDESDDSEDGDEVGGGQGTSTATGPEWGKKARKRQRVMVKKMLEAHERKLAEEQEDEEDKDIEEYLVD